MSGVRAFSIYTSQDYADQYRLVVRLFRIRRGGGGDYDNSGEREREENRFLCGCINVFLAQVRLTGDMIGAFDIGQ